ncbi:hypothetical protein GCK72_001933 [Caenorhabditis remanei]|uniref:Myb-like domain-containing protein n=1 Tax=Caenorhabditis remanei TaxID=31234 RepID=A0A6A5HR78_CAERE|nr:hypothetical protein GCK72_001933 [Caenorhabditis remanei]KAF1770115.1 hypothetical protein GCK72_001933 [Caenorhabditis remanei]
MRRSRIQIKPNVAKAAKQSAPLVATPAPVVTDAVETIPETVVTSEVPIEMEDVVINQNSSPENQDAPSESMKSLHVDVAKSDQNHHVHFTDDVIDNEQIRREQTGEVKGNQNNVSLLSPTSQFASPHPPARLTPRSRNVSMCEDEAILQPKPPREKKRFTGKEELDTKTWKMSDLTRWNPKNERTNFKRERRSSTSSTIITKSEIGDFDAPSPRINAPQVKIGADGRLVIDETSLVVQSAQINHESVWETVEEGRMGSNITSMSFRNRISRKPNLWSERETDLFYEVLQCTGTDFGLMHHYLSTRSRSELKAKYNREEKQNWGRILKATSQPVRLDGQLEVRIAKLMAEIEEEVQEKKAKHEYEKSEERRVREQNRLQKANERHEEKIRRMQAKELIRQARELEKDARNAQKLSQQLNEKAEKEARARERSETRQLEKQERMDVKKLALEAKKCAIEAKKIIKEKRKSDTSSNKEPKIRAESHNLEREAERIIRRMILESQREERRAAQLERNKLGNKKDSEAGPSSSTPVTPALSNDVDPNASNADIGMTTSEESSSTETSSDEDAVNNKIARREKERMKEAKRKSEPRKTTIEHKPIYVNTMDAKYAQQPVKQAVEMALKAKGTLFDSADEDDEIPPVEHMDTSTSAAQNTPTVQDDSAPGPAPPVMKDIEKVNETEKEVEEEEPVPQAVTDVVEEVIRARSKTPVATNSEESQEVKKNEDKKRDSERMNSEEPPAKMARVEVDSDDIVIDVVGEVDASGDNNVMEIDDEVIDVVTVDPAPVVLDEESSISTSEPCTSTAPIPSTSSLSASEPAPKPSKKSTALPRRTVKKPVTWAKKK